MKLLLITLGIFISTTILAEGHITGDNQNSKEANLDRYKRKTDQQSHNSIVKAVYRCTISKRNGGLVIEKQPSRSIIKKMYESTLEETLNEYQNLIHDSICLPAKKHSCDLTKRNGGFAIENTRTRVLLSNLQNSSDLALEDLQLLTNLEVCKSN